MKGAYPINKFVTEISQNRPAKLLVFSVGNPSPKFDATRHNAGHMALNYFIEHSGGLSQSEMHWDSSVEIAPLKEHENVYMAKSLEFMNNSGRAFKAAVNRMGPHCRIIVVHDDIDTQQGMAKFKLESRQMGAHGGLNSITKHFPDGFARIRIGIGSPESRMPGDVASYVLRKIPIQERQVLMEKTIPEAFEMFTAILERYNKKPKARKTKEPNPQS